jgi:DNA-binding response OmpR family regulator
MFGDTGSILRVLVADHRPLQRRTVADALRAAERVDVGYAESGDQSLLALAYFQPDILIADWDLDGGQGLHLVRRLRSGEAGGEYRKLPVIILATHHATGDVERARNAGADEFVLRPFSTFTLAKRIQEVLVRKREFIESPDYVGPCRRRRTDPHYDGPRRRLLDRLDKSADAPDVQIRKSLARMYVERIGMLQCDAADNPDGMRDVCMACAQLSALASDMKDRMLISAASSLFNYVKGVDAGAELNGGVMQAHLDAIVQLAELPNANADLRQTVMQALNVTVANELRRAGKAA